MSSYHIEFYDGYDHIVSAAPKFTLRVIPPESQAEDKDYPPYKVVGALFEPEEVPNIGFDSEELYSIACSRALLKARCPLDFEGVDIFYAADDVPHCNQPLWLAAINFYCQEKFARKVIWLQAYNYDFVLSELNCTPETLASLRGE